MSSCPQETCENIVQHSEPVRLCKEDSCIEGCLPKPCPPGEVYLNSSLIDCVPRSICKIPCLKVGNMTYYEKDIMSQDDCHTCRCLNGREICTGVLCATPSPTTTPQIGTVTVPTVGVPSGEHRLQCNSGWSDWINQNVGPPFTSDKGGNQDSDVEPLPDSLAMVRSKPRQ